MHLALFGFFTGLHLALLQFGYLFMLIMNVSSTYVTYMMIVLSWMGGTLLGLRWSRLDGRIALALGVAAYYGIYAVIAASPLAGFTLPLAAAGVVFSGLWAGRFFVVMRPYFGRVDSLFFHENNGFMLGVMAVFIGFTTLGRPFLLVGPLMTGIGLLVHLLLIPRLGVAEEGTRIP
jgi:hypothetical protein